MRAPDPRAALRMSSAVVLPNIGLFLAYGLLLLLFGEGGFVPNERLARLSEPLLTLLIPVLLAVQGARAAAGDRGGVAAVLAMLGLAAGANGAMMVGALLIGPLAGSAVRALDRSLDGRIPKGLEMLIGNFSLALLGIAFALFGYFAISPVLAGCFALLTRGVNGLIAHNLLPLTAALIEPIKLLFLNNSLNHGLLSPLGAAHAAQNGASILFLLEANPGPGLGLLLAFCLHARRRALRSGASGALVIELVGGIHEMYFPYVLMQPILILAPMLGNAAAIALLSVTGAGLTAPASPGSLLSCLLLAPPEKRLAVLASVALGAAVSFAVACPLLRRAAAGTPAAAAQQAALPDLHLIKHIVFACEAGFGSSAVGAAWLQKRLPEGRVRITHAAADQLPPDADLIVCQRGMARQVCRAAPHAAIWELDYFTGDPRMEMLAVRLAAGEDAAQMRTPLPSERFQREDIRLGLPACTAPEAIEQAGALLQARGYVEPGYIASMLAREQQLTTCVGLGVALPHGTAEGRGFVKKIGIVLLQFAEDICFEEQGVRLVFGLAAPPAQHLALLEEIAELLEDEERLAALKDCCDPEEALRLLRGGTAQKWEDECANRNI